MKNPFEQVIEFFQSLADLAASPQCAQDVMALNLTELIDRPQWNYPELFLDNLQKHLITTGSQGEIGMFLSRIAPL